MNENKNENEINSNKNFIKEKTEFQEIQIQDKSMMDEDKKDIFNIKKNNDGKTDFKQVDIQKSPTLSRSNSLNGQVVVGPRLSISSFKEWSLSTIKCTKQLLEEQFLSTTKTQDIELQFKISDLMETKQNYRKLLNSANNLLNHMRQTSHLQKDFSDLLNEFSQKNQPLYEPFIANAEVQKICYKNSNKIEEVLRMFICNLTTLSEKTMEDAILTVKQYDSARLEYDAYRNDLEKLKSLSSVDAKRLKDAETKYEDNLLKFEKIKADLKTKLKLLEENKLKVLHRNLVVLFEAYTNASSNNQEVIDQISSKYNFSSPLENSSFLNL